MEVTYRIFKIYNQMCYRVSFMSRHNVQFIQRNKYLKIYQIQYLNPKRIIGLIFVFERIH